MYKAVFCWSGGKDSSLALYEILQWSNYEIVSLITTLNANHKRISMHGIREELLDMQADAIGLPLTKVWVSQGNNEEYERQMAEKLIAFKENGVTHVFFGDIFLDDLRLYREQKLAAVGLIAVFPLWKRNTTELVNRFYELGFRSITCCVSNKTLNETFVGKVIDPVFVESLPETVDPCGENGEFHSFCFNGPLFQKPVSITTGETIFREFPDNDAEKKHGFWFIDIIPVIS